MRTVLTIFVLLASWPLAPAAADEHTAGTVVRLQAPVLAVQDALPRVLSVGDPVFVGDVISTGKGARIQVRMIDDSVFNLGERTSFTIIDYVYRDEAGNAALRLLEGSFRAVTGKLAQASGGSFTVETEVATIGIRGTDFWGGALDGVFNIALLGGAGIVIENRAGRVEITEVGVGTTITSADVAPTTPKRWPQAKLRRAAETVKFD